MLQPGSANAEIASGQGQQQASASSYFVEQYIPRKADFSTNVNTAISYADPKWNALSLTQKAEHVQGVVDTLLAYRGSDYSYINSNVIICMIKKESDYRPNIRTSSPKSTASGLGQVTQGTIKELLTKRWFQPLMPGFNKDLSPKDYRVKSAGSMNEQINLIVSVFHLKRAEAGSRDMHTILKRYRGASASINKAYADDVMACKNCIDKNGITESCLEKAR